MRSLLGYLGYDNVTLDVQDTLLPVQITDDPALVINIRGAGTERLLIYDVPEAAEAQRREAP